MTHHTSESVSFISQGERCFADFYMPAVGQAPYPLVIMGSGYAAERSLGTPGFVDRFLGAGLSVLLFDYRNFGQSEGQPRQLVDPSRHVQDWLAAIQYAPSIKSVDPERIALWGTSFGGGHVLTAGASAPGIKAIVAQVPHCDTYAAFETVSLGHAAKGMAHAFKDLFGSLVGRPPHTIPIVGEPDEYAVMNHPNWKRDYLKLAERAENTWVNAIPARSLLRGGNYRPIKVVQQIQCPALLVYGSDDEGVPAAAVEKTAGLMKNATLHRYTGAHFDVYDGPVFKEVAEIETNFLKKHLMR